MSSKSLTINEITNTISENIKISLGDKLCKIILYGSYARGDSNKDSDIDVMVLADIEDDEELHRMEKTLWNIGWDIGIENNIMISIFLKNDKHFYEWINAMAYYQNIAKDGVVLYG
jgi:predicted nucleotidyltransferase